MTQELAIVQGPPGTGKTYLGLKVVETLLCNSSIWNGTEEKLQRPILVLCYTNHALDQFLEGISEFEEEHIVRVGSRSKNPAMEKYNLNNIRSEMMRERLMPRDIGFNFREIKAEMEELHENMLKVSVMMEAADTHVLSEHELEEVLSDSVVEELQRGYWQSLEDGDGFQTGRKRGKASREPGSYLGEWLGVGMRVMGSGLEEMLEECNKPAEPTLQEGEKVEIRVEDEAQLEEEQRLDEEGQELVDYLQRQGRRRDERMREVQIAYVVEGTEADAEDIRKGEWRISKKEQKRRAKLVGVELSKRNVMSEEERELFEQQLWLLPEVEKWRLYRTWVLQYKLLCQDTIRNQTVEYDRHSNRLKEVKEQETLHVLRRAKVVGMTTTGAARLHSVLGQLQPKVIVVEEAAEVLEAHIVASLTSSCQQLILIGDQQQLRPNPTVYELAKDYGLDVSLFERLIKNRVGFTRLETQHRMRPEIRGLLAPHIYKQLADHPSVLSYPNVLGVRANMYFVDHKKMENEVSDGHSKVNEHEASFLVELCRYLIRQNYQPSQITILTTYAGQLFAFKKRMPRNEFLGVRVSTVDNYQGEENDIILLSLVRSNIQGSIGFLGTDNRVCVALSRARHGLFCLGNFSQLCAKSVLWSKLLSYVRRAGLLGTGLPLCCQLHPEYSLKVSNDYAIRAGFPEGGCKRPCSARLDCGHACQLSCHPKDPRHKEYRCRQQCARKHPDCGHPCKKPCFEDCGRCPVPLQVELPKCGHTQTVRCGDDVKQVVCLEKCSKTRSCGHSCLLVCGVDCTNPANRCLEPVPLQLPCAHQITVPCFAKESSQECIEPCHRILDCGHSCPGSCKQCRGDRLHLPCAERVCSRLLVGGCLEFFVFTIFLRYVDIYAENPVGCLACAGFPVKLPAATAGVARGVESLAAHVQNLAPGNVHTALALLSAAMNALQSLAPSPAQGCCNVATPASASAATHALASAQAVARWMFLFSLARRTRKGQGLCSWWTAPTSSMPSPLTSG